jgi:hypothetical protein
MVGGGRRKATRTRDTADSAGVEERMGWIGATILDCCGKRPIISQHTTARTLSEVCAFSIVARYTKDDLRSTLHLHENAHSI